MSIVASLKRTELQVIVLAVIIGGQVSNVLTSIVSAISQGARLAFMPGASTSIAVSRAIASSLLFLASQIVIGIVIACGTVWVLARVLERVNAERAHPESIFPNGTA